jgi:nucleoside-diphosphate-sugar epimerase
VRILVTGAFGNIGSHTVDALLEAGHEVRAMRFERKQPSRQVGARWTARVQVVDADLRVPASLPPLLDGIDAVIHLAYVIPPRCLEAPAEARRINVDGTVNLIAAMRSHAPQARLLFSSSLDVFGNSTRNPPPRRSDEPVNASDAYTEHKLECEERVRDSGLTWSILRYADVPPMELRGPVPIMFDISPAQRIEVIHPRDAGLATARAAAHPEAWGHIWLIGGGRSCQLTYREYLTRFFSAMEMGGPLPEHAFTTSPYYTDWLDTDESQRLFQYQRASWDDIVRDVAALLGWRRPLARLFRPIVRWQMLRMSPYYRLPPGSSRERRAATS